MTDEQKAIVERQFAWRLAGYMKSRRKENGWSQRDLGEYAGLAQSTISDYERKDRKKMPNLAQRRKLAAAFGETHTEFMRGIKRPTR